MDIAQIIAPRFLPQIAQTAPYVEDTNPPTANERQGLEYAIVSAIMNDPIAQVGYAPGVLQHAGTSARGAAGSYYPIAGSRMDDRIYIDPRLRGDASYPSVGAHEFRHRGFRQLGAADRPDFGTLPMLDEVAQARNSNPRGAAAIDQALSHRDSEEHFNRLIDASRGSGLGGNQSANSYAARMQAAGIDRAMPNSAVAPAEQLGEAVVRALAERMLRNPRQRWGDW